MEFSFPNFKGVITISDESGKLLYANPRMSERLQELGCKDFIGASCNNIIDQMSPKNASAFVALDGINMDFSELEEAKVISLTSNEPSTPSYYCVKFKHVFETHVAAIIAAVPMAECSKAGFLSHVHDTFSWLNESDEIEFTVGN